MPEEANSLLLAILGRGIQHPSADAAEWDLTEDLEVCDEKGAHLSVRVPEHDEDPLSLVGGGHMNLDAGKILIQQLQPSLVVCAYGARSKYLASINAPSESEIMSQKISGSEVKIFKEEHRVDASGTNQELYNIFGLAAERGMKNVAIVTVAVHIPRSAIMAQHHLVRNEAFKGIVLKMFASEEVLSPTEPERANKMFKSQSYVRTLKREFNGVNDFLAGKYKEISSTKE